MFVCVATRELQPLRHVMPCHAKLNGLFLCMQFFLHLLLLMAATSRANARELNHLASCIFLLPPLPSLAILCVSLMPFDSGESAENSRCWRWQRRSEGCLML